MKERLTGAIILVALIVLLVPELLTGPLRTKSAPAARPADAQSPLRTYTLTLTPAAGAPTREAPAAAAATVAATVAAAPAQTGESGGESQPPAAHSAHRADAPRSSQSSLEAGSGLQATKSPAHPVVRAAHSSGSSGGWVVQLGSFASRENADRLASRLRGKGFPMSVSPARAGSRVLWRVRAGPVPSRAGAGRLAARLRALGHGGELLPLK